MSMKNPHEPMRTKWKSSHIQRLTEERDAARAACRALVIAYAGGEDSESVDWSDIDRAYELAAIALAGEADGLPTSGESDAEPEPEPEPEPAFALKAEPARRPMKPVFASVPTKQKPLFIGANDEPGQSYLFGTGVEPGYAHREQIGGAK